MKHKIDKIKNNKFTDLVLCSLGIFGTSLLITHSFSNNDSISQSLDDMSYYFTGKAIVENEEAVRERMFNQLVKNNPTIEGLNNNFSSKNAIGVQMRLHYISTLRDSGVFENMENFSKHTAMFKDFSSDRLYQLQKIKSFDTDALFKIHEDLALKHYESSKNLKIRLFEKKAIKLKTDTVSSYTDNTVSAQKVRL